MNLQLILNNTNFFYRFNFAARKLHKRLEQLGGKEIYPRGEGDEQHEEGYVKSLYSSRKVFTFITISLYICLFYDIICYVMLCYLIFSIFYIFSFLFSFLFYLLPSLFSSSIYYLLLPLSSSFSPPFSFLSSTFNSCAS